jgi:membrane-bound serine protease (ClpP class)
VLEELLNPTVVFVLFYVGLMLIGIELVTPGLSIPGAAGAVALVASFIGFGTLPVRLGGVILLLASVGFFLFEAKYPGVGLSAVAAVATLVLGGYLLIDPNASDEQGVSPWAIAPIALATVLFFIFLIPAALRAQRAPSLLSVENLVGSEGVAETDLGPDGVARVRSETWSAESLTGYVAKGTPIRVVGSDGLRVTVEPVASSDLDRMADEQGG